METKNIEVSVHVSKSPEVAFIAICRPDTWWSGKITGEANELGNEFEYQYKEMHSSMQKVVELLPNERVTWKVTKSTINFLENKEEWTGTEIQFVITPEENGSLIHFTHVGIGPHSQCYNACSSGWKALIEENLKNYIENGNVQPDAFE